MRILSFIALAVLISIPFDRAFAFPDPLIPVFEITGAGKLYHVEDPISKGVKPAVTSITAALIASCIIGTSPCDTDVENDAQGKAYLFIIDNHTVYLATNTSCTNPTQL